MRFLLLFALSAISLFSSCNAYKPADEAFYLTASSINLSTVSGQGSASHHITDLWLYVNNQFQGCYPVGKLMPIVSKGDPVRIQVFAGIKNNGISGTRIFWPFYESLTIDTAVSSNTRVSRSFNFKYAGSTVFEWRENFEESGRTLVKSANSETDYKVISGSEAFEGASATLGLENQFSVAQLESAQWLKLPRANANVYLELDYKCNAPFSVGLLADDGSDKHVYSFNEQENWNKVYIQLAEKVNLDPSTNTHKVYFRLLNTNNPNARIYLDNIKVVYLP